jgi:hypothetical protein
MPCRGGLGVHAGEGRVEDRVLGLVEGGLGERDGGDGVVLG